MKVVEFKTAVKLKEIGFTLAGRGYYQIHSSEEFGQFFQSKEPKIHNEVDYPWKTYQAPYQYEVIDWFREVYNVHIVVGGRLIDTDKIVYNLEVYGDKDKEDFNDIFDGYTEALEQGILEAIKYIENDNIN